MADLRRDYAAKLETESASKRIFIIVAAIIVGLVLAAMGALYLGISTL